MMRIWRFDSFGSLANLRLMEAPVPEPVEGEVVVRLACAALNPADRILILGHYPRAGTPPFAVGRDGAGTVVSAPEGSRFQEGDAVVVLHGDLGVTRDGTLAEYVAAPEISLAPLPAGWTFEEGAAAPLVALTAWQALVEVCALEPGQTVLLTGAGGGVGTMAVQLAKGLDARVVALTRGPAKRARLAALGADMVLDAAPGQDWVQAGKSALDGDLVDAVVDNLAGPFLQQAINLARDRARIAIVGLLAGSKSELIGATILFKRVRIEGVALGSYTPAEKQKAWEGALAVLERTGARPVIDRVFPFDRVPEAFEHLGHSPFGKVVIRIRG